MEAIREGVEGSSESSTASEPLVKEKFSIRRLSTRKKALLATLFLSYVLEYMNLSVVAPFFPQEASAKGLSPAVYGWIFGVLPLAQFFFSPFSAKIQLQTNPKFMFIIGTLIVGVSTVLFGFLDGIPHADKGVTFAVFCFAVRIVTAAGQAASITSSYTIMALEFGEHVSAVFGLGELFVGVGYAGGPALGGALHTLGGFRLPFVVLGGMQLLIIPLAFKVISDYEDQEEQPKSTSLIRLFLVPAIALQCLCVMVCAAVYAALEPALSPRLSEFKLSSFYVGLVFLVVPATYATCSVFCGWFCSRHSQRVSMMTITVGLLVMAAAYLAQGPCPLIVPDETFNSLILNIVALFFIGSGFAFAIIPTYECVLHAAVLAGFPESPSVFGAIGGLWAAMYAFGEFLGPVMSGFLIDRLNFQWCMSVMAFMLTAVFCIFVFYILCQRRAENLYINSFSEQQLPILPTVHPDASLSRSRAVSIHHGIRWRGQILKTKMPASKNLQHNGYGARRRRYTT